MPLTEQQTQLACTIDTHATHVLAYGGGDEELLMSLADYKGTFKQLMDMSTGKEMSALCQRYDGFYPLCETAEEVGRGPPMAASPCLNESQRLTHDQRGYQA
jgi:hypothetical protein